jgi:hypothetical protein
MVPTIIEIIIAVVIGGEVPKIRVVLRKVYPADGPLISGHERGCRMQNAMSLTLACRAKINETKGFRLQSFMEEINA